MLPRHVLGSQACVRARPGELERLTESIQVDHARVLRAAYVAHPERFVRQVPVPPPLPGPAWINKPRPESRWRPVGVTIAVLARPRGNSGRYLRVSNLAAPP